VRSCVIWLNHSTTPFCCIFGAKISNTIPLPLNHFLNSSSRNSPPHHQFRLFSPCVWCKSRVLLLALEFLLDVSLFNFGYHFQPNQLQLLITAKVYLNPWTGRVERALKVYMKVVKYIFDSKGFLWKGRLMMLPQCTAIARPEFTIGLNIKTGYEFLLR
jgi:hypothetical protein